VLQVEGGVLDEARVGEHHGKHALGAHRKQVQALDAVEGHVGAHHEAGPPGHVRQHPGGVLEKAVELFHAAVVLVLQAVLLAGGQALHAHYIIHVGAVTLVGRHAPARGVGLHQVALGLQFF
jgi:hypothetical protein